MLRRPAFLLVGLLAHASALAACGTEPPATATPPPPVQGTRFVDGFAAGAKEAGHPDRILFVYVGRHNPH